MRDDLSKIKPLKYKGITIDDLKLLVDKTGWRLKYKVTKTRH